MAMSKLWVDDIRRPPDDTWLWARTNEEAQLILLNNEIEEASLDHDMGCHDHDPDAEGSFMQVADNWWLFPDGYELVEWMIEHDLVPPKVNIHSWNPHGALRMAAALRRRGGVQASIKPYERPGKPVKPWEISA
jgi:hypothetical protein